MLIVADDRAACYLIVSDCISTHWNGHEVFSSIAWKLFQIMHWTSYRKMHCFHNLGVRLAFIPVQLDCVQKSNSVMVSFANNEHFREFALVKTVNNLVTNCAMMSALSFSVQAKKGLPSHIFGSLCGNCDCGNIC